MESVRRAIAVHDVRDDLGRVVARAAHGVMGKPGHGAVIGVKVLRRGADQKGGLEVADDAAEDLRQPMIALPGQARDLVVGEVEKDRAVGGCAENFQRRGGFAAAHGTPRRAVGGSDEPLALHHALRPRIVLAGRDEDDAHVAGALDEPSRADHFIVGVRRDDQYAIRIHGL